MSARQQSKRAVFAWKEKFRRELRSSPWGQIVRGHTQNFESRLRIHRLFLMGALTFEQEMVDITGIHDSMRRCMPGIIRIITTQLFRKLIREISFQQLHTLLQKYPEILRFDENRVVESTINQKCVGSSFTM